MGDRQLTHGPGLSGWRLSWARRLGPPGRAASQGLTRVTYDRRTIPPLLKQWAEEGRHHGGVIFVDEKTISPADIGGLVTALAELAKVARDWEWQDRICFLRR